MAQLWQGFYQYRKTKIVRTIDGMTDDQIQRAALHCRGGAIWAASSCALPDDVSATVTAILVEAVKQATPELSAQGRQRLFEGTE